MRTGVLRLGKPLGNACCPVWKDEQHTLVYHATLGSANVPSTTSTSGAVLVCAVTFRRCRVPSVAGRGRRPMDQKDAIDYPCC